MTPDEFKNIRTHLGLSAARLAERLGVASGRTIRKWEAGKHPIPWEIGQRMARYAEDLPEFFVVLSAEAHDGNFWILPRDWPEMLITGFRMGQQTLNMDVVGSKPPSMSDAGLDALLQRAKSALMEYGL